jgi:uncharacterized protein YprB with RNaseH-like and TPR domain
MAAPSVTAFRNSLPLYLLPVFTDDAVRSKLRRLKLEANIPLTADDGQIPVPPFVGFRVAFFDTESTSLTAIMGRLLCASVADSWGKVTTKRCTDFERRDVLDDRGLCVWLRDELENNYDIMVGWNSRLHDVPLLNARLVMHGERPLHPIMQIDAMWKARPNASGIKIGSSKLVNVAKFFQTPDQKTDLDWGTWQLAAAGDEAAMDYIVEHCEADTLVLRAVFHRLKPLIRSVQR